MSQQSLSCDSIAAPACGSDNSGLLVRSAHRLVATFEFSDSGLRLKFWLEDQSINQSVYPQRISGYVHRPQTREPLRLKITLMRYTQGYCDCVVRRAAGSIERSIQVLRMTSLLLPLALNELLARAYVPLALLLSTTTPLSFNNCVNNRICSCCIIINSAHLLSRNSSNFSCRLRISSSAFKFTS
jgi:hypothetical protein